MAEHQEAQQKSGVFALGEKIQPMRTILSDRVISTC